ncbi:hypothetical protein GGP41_002907 [Bipolaris sorokiniana]|uniref:RecA family profile 1 domain-containing protein n=1 Tax=Cochliobolus sativus TaxID=45130 RepID=A0A8H6DRM0_COCSA|nr:hypothetical protein GGP41_002907 [Bipolaris sorokiniana]
MAGEEASQLSPLSHRLPTVSASQALQDFNARGARTVSTGITQLDKALSVPAPPGHDASGGYTRGKVTEIFGPSGVGKTTFGRRLKASRIQAAVSALREGQRVIWVDAACAPLVQHRIDDILVPYPDEMRSRFQYTVAPTLAHVVALFVHPPASFPPQNTSLIVIDSLATLIDNAYPRVEWEAGVSTRLVLFRDWVRHGKPTDKSDAERLQRARFAGLVKANGVAFADEGGVGNVVAFTIEKARSTQTQLDVLCDDRLLTRCRMVFAT